MIWGHYDKDANVSKLLREGQAVVDTVINGGTRDLLSAESRRAIIASFVETESEIKVAYICERFGVSEVTARNDLRILASAGKLRRTRGGGCSLAQGVRSSFPEMRVNVNADSKRAIARRAAQMVEDNDFIAVDAGTTTFEFVRCIDIKKHIRIMTYDLDIALYVDSRMPNARVVMPGGEVRRNHRYLVGPMVTSSLQRWHFDKVFLATDSFSSRQGFTTGYIESAFIKECLIKQSHWKVMLMDASKVRGACSERFSTLEDIDAIIMDYDPGNTVRLSIDALSLGQIADLILVGGETSREEGR